MKISSKHYYNYVCYKCFNRINKCSCNFSSPCLIMIDKAIQEHVRILNQKGYKTIGSCEGHYKSDCVNFYITFGIEYDIFGSLPDGFIYNPIRRSIIYKYSAITKSDYEIEKQKALNKLLVWVNNI